MPELPALSSLRQNVEAWARGRNPYVRVPLLLWFAWILRGHLRDPLYISLFGGLNLGVHELGHVVFSPLGMTAGIAGGSVLQCVLPLVAAGMFVRQGDWFAVAVAFCWLATNLFGVATYIDDADALALPLVSPFAGEPIHDWQYLLREYGGVQRANALAATVRVGATVTMLLGIAAGAWVLWQMRGRAARG